MRCELLESRRLLSVSAEVSFDGVPAEASVGSDQNGTTVHVWPDPFSANLHTRSFDRTGALVSSSVIARSGDFVGVPSVDVAPNGKWAVAWVQRAGKMKSVQAATFSDPLDTSAMRVTVFSTDRNSQFFLENSNAVPAAVAVNDSGALTVGYVETLYVKNTTPNSASVQRISPTGQRVGSPVQSTGPWIVSLAVDMNASGQAVAIWENNTSVISNLGDLNGRRFASNGSAVGGIFAVNATALGDDSLPKVGMADSGSFVASWRKTYQGAGAPRPRPAARVFDANGIGGSEIFIGRAEDVGTDEYRVLNWHNIAVAPDGSWAALYGQSHSWDVTPEGGPQTQAGSVSTLLQQYAPDGTPVGLAEELTRKDSVWTLSPLTVVTQTGQNARAEALFATGTGEFFGIYQDDQNYDNTYDVLAGRFVTQ